MRLYLIVVWFHWKLHTKKERNYSGRWGVRRILLTCIQPHLLQFLQVIWSMPTNFALFKKPLNKFLSTWQSQDQLSKNIPCKFQEHWKQGRLLSRASYITNFSLGFWVYKCEHLHYSLTLFSSFICIAQLEKEIKLHLKELSISDLSEISRGKRGGNFKLGFGNEVTHPWNGSEIY